MANLEADKKEPILSINAFNKPTELLGPKAWSQLILNLIFLMPGTYPSITQMGVGIQNYEYDFVDAAVQELNDRITDQVRTYLPDIPLQGINVSSFDYQGHTILMIAIQLIDHGTITTSVIASEVTDRIIDFDISWM